MALADELIEVRREGGVLVLIPAADVSALRVGVTQEGVVRYVQGWIDLDDEPRVVVDMDGLTFADSMFLTVLIRLWKRVCAKGGKMVLAAVPADIDRVLLNNTKLNTIWSSYPSRAEAITALEK